MAFFTVTILQDEDDGNVAADDLSLREAVKLANDSPGLDTISFDPSLSGGTMRIGQFAGAIESTGSLILDGDINDDGVPDITLSGDSLANDTLATVNGVGFTDLFASNSGQLFENSRILNITGSDTVTTITGFNITGGRTTLPETYSFENVNSGGAIRSEGFLQFFNSTVRGNETIGANAKGGAVFATGFRATDSSFLYNETQGEGAYGGAIYSFSTIEIRDSIVHLNATTGTSADGGAIYSASTTEITGSDFRYNSANALNSDGGAILSRGNVTVANSTIYSNLTGFGASSSGGAINSFGDVTITNSDISNNETRGANSSGGGIYAIGDVLLVNSTMYSNDTSSITNDATLAHGGAVFSVGSTTAINSTLAGNRTLQDDSSGGAIFSTGGVRLVNSTLVNNYAGLNGGGVYAAQNSTVTLHNSILAANRAVGIGPDVASASQANTTLTLLGNNILGSAPAGFTTQSQTPAPIIIDGTDIDAVRDVFANVGLTNDGTLSPAVTLLQNGGPVRTAALAQDPANPALDASDSGAAIDLDEAVLLADLNNDGDQLDTFATIGDLPFDARGPGFDRDVDLPGVGGTPDLGAFELQSLGNPVPTNDGAFTAQFVPIFSIDVLANDVDNEGDPLTVTAVTVPAGGRAFINADGTVSYAPRPEFVGDDSFEYTVADDGGLEATGTVGINVTPLDDAIVCARIIAYLYEATFNRFPDIPGLNFWIDAFFGDLPGQVGSFTKLEIAQFFLDSPEFAATFGDVNSLTDQELIETLFLNTLDRPGDQAGVDFWVSVLADPNFTRADMLIAFAQSPENQLGSPRISTLSEVSPSEWRFEEDQEIVGDIIDDTLAGGAGYDTLTGGDGADTFEFRESDTDPSAPFVTDVITDYNPNEGDAVDILASPAFNTVGSSLAAPFLAPGDPIPNDAQITSDGSGDTQIVIDYNEDGVFGNGDQEVILQGHDQLTDGPILGSFLGAEI